jgi:chaperonin GroEL
MSNKVQNRNIFDIIHETVNDAVNLVKPTFGPSSNKVIISKNTHNIVVDDGVQILRDLEFNDPVKNAILKIIRETAIKTNDIAGDGTTGAMLILQGIINQVRDLPEIHGREIELELKAAAEKVKEQLLEDATKITSLEDLKKVARISFDDPKISALIAEAWFKLGVDGVLTPDRSGTMETFMELSDGIKIENGFISPYMVTDPQRMESAVEKPHILFTDYRLTEANDVLSIMKILADKQILNAVVICDNLESSALATVIANKLQGKFNLVAVNIPKGIENKTNYLEDLALMTGSKVFSEKKGNRLESVKYEDFGRAERFVSSKDSSAIVGPKAKGKDLLNAKKALHVAISESKKTSEKDELKKRLARLSNKIGLIRVGAPTENESRALRYKVEDSIHATHAALRNGVVAGGGFALAALRTDSLILSAGLSSPLKQIRLNIGGKVEFSGSSTNAVNFVTGKAGPFLSVGVADPVDVLIAQIDSAVSIACMLITSTGFIVECPDKEKK